MWKWLMSHYQSMLKLWVSPIFILNKKYSIFKVYMNKQYVICVKNSKKRWRFSQIFTINFNRFHPSSSFPQKCVTKHNKTYIKIQNISEYVKISSFIVILCEKIKKCTRFYEGKKNCTDCTFVRKFLLHFATEVSFGSAALTTAKTTWEWPPPPPQNERRKKRRVVLSRIQRISWRIEKVVVSAKFRMLMTVRLECWQGTGYDCFRDAEAEEDERRRSRLSDFIAFAHAAKRGKCGASEAIYAWPLSSYLDLKHKFIFRRQPVWRWPCIQFHDLWFSFIFSGYFACRCSRTWEAMRHGFSFLYHFV